MAKSRQQPLAMRRKIFRELQRKLHPDKMPGPHSNCLEDQRLAVRFALLL